jgi:hypothetical protein
MGVASPFVELDVGRRTVKVTNPSRIVRALRVQPARAKSEEAQRTTSKARRRSRPKPA